MDTFPDETDHQSAESEAELDSLGESLRASEARYRELFENANDLVFTVDLQGTFTSMNRTAEETTKFSRDELVGSDLSVLVAPEYVDRVREMMRRKMATHERTRYEIEILAKDGRRVPLEIGSRLIYENDEPIGIQGIARDVSERKRAEQQLKHSVAELERSNLELQQFAAVASHDMHAPLRRIVDLGRKVKEGKTSLLDDEGIEWIKSILASATQMQHLIDDLLAHSLVGASWKPAECVECDWAVGRAVNNIADDIEKSGAELRVGNLPTVMANQVELVQLFQNLIGNAIKYRGSVGPFVEVTAERQGDEWLFSVRDNGIGIPREYQGMIFGAFHRLHSDDEYEGTGIGLATCKKIVERMGGQIWVESEAGQGAKFLFTLPAGHSP